MVSPMETTFVARWTEKHVARTEALWSKYAGEAVTVDPGIVGSPIGEEPVYVFGSELAILRLHLRMKCGRVLFSKSMNSWCYASK